MKLERLDHFGIEVSELVQAERFYTEVLGLTVVAHLGDQVLLQCGDQNLALFHVTRPARSPEERQRIITHPLGKGHHAFRVSRADFAAARERLSQAGVESGRLIDWGDHDCMYFLDPDGNLLEIVSYR
jgi:catechol 2,3-dioxygenase-like lactoylglutathione lyase family enzyme